MIYLPKLSKRNITTTARDARFKGHPARVVLCCFAYAIAASASIAFAFGFTLPSMISAPGALG